MYAEVSVWHLGDYIINKISIQQCQLNMASDPEKWEHFTITSTVWHLHTD